MKEDGGVSTAARPLQILRHDIEIEFPVVQQCRVMDKDRFAVSIRTNTQSVVNKHAGVK